MRFQFLAALLFVLAGNAWAGTLVLSSTATFKGPSNGNDRALSVAVDSAGNSIIAGYVTKGGTDTDYLVVKYDPDMIVIASATYDNPLLGYEAAYAVAVDTADNILVTGTSTDDVFTRVCVTIKYSPGLTVISSATYAVFAKPITGYAVAADTAGAVFVAGWIEQTTGDYFVVKYGPDMVVRSSVTYDGPGHKHDYARGVAVDPSGNVIVTGYTDLGAGNYDYVTIKYSADLSVILSSRTFDGAPGNAGDIAYAVTTGPSGSIIVTGASYNGTDPDYCTIKYDPNLVALATATYAGPGSRQDYGRAVAVDGSGNFVVSGISGFGLSYFTIKYDPNMVVLASAAYRTDASDAGVGTAVDATGSIVVAGERIAGPGDVDCLALRYYGNPAVNAVLPVSGECGQTLDVTVTGRNFKPGAAVSFSGSGITVNSTSRTGSMQLTANITIAANAAASQRSITVTNVDAVTAGKAFAFEVKAPTVSSSTPTGTSSSIDPSNDLTFAFVTLTGQGNVSIPAHTFPATVTVTVSTITVPAPDRDTLRTSAVGVDITNDQNLQPGKAITITLNYSASDVAGMDERTLAIGRYDDVNRRWIVLPSVVDTVSRRVTATVTHLSKFALLFPVAAKDLGGVRVYPNPFNRRDGVLNIENLTDTADIKIFTVAGELVRALPYNSADGRALWDGKNDGGNNVASGVYILFIDSPQGKKKVKIAVER